MISLSDWRRRKLYWIVRHLALDHAMRRVTGVPLVLTIVTTAGIVLLLQFLTTWSTQERFPREQFLSVVMVVPVLGAIYLIQVERFERFKRRLLSQIGSIARAAAVHVTFTDPDLKLFADLIDEIFRTAGWPMRSPPAADAIRIFDNAIPYGLLIETNHRQCGTELSDAFIHARVFPSIRFTDQPGPSYVNLRLYRGFEILSKNDLAGTWMAHSSERP